jgi:PKD repeat protein
MDGTIVETYWDFGDGETATGYTVNHTFLDDGEYQVNFTVVDDDGGIGLATKTIYVKNIAPKPQFNISPLAGNTTTTFTFTSSSSDTDGTITNYTWEFGDGNVSYTATATHEYAEPGNYTIILRLWDDDGELAEISEYIVVEKAPVLRSGSL